VIAACAGEFLHGHAFAEFDVPQLPQVFVGWVLGQEGHRRLCRHGCSNSL
jgi:hypothetical protein